MSDSKTPRIAIGIAATLAVVALVAVLRGPTPAPVEPIALEDIEPEPEPEAPPRQVLPSLGETPSDVADEAFRTTDSGLKIADLVEGTGAEATVGMTVVMDYALWNVEGDLVGASVARAGGAPYAFVVGGGGVIPGWDEGVRGMRVGGKRQLRIPPGLQLADRQIEGVPQGTTITLEATLREVHEARVVPEAPAAVPEGAWTEREDGARVATLEPGDGLEAADGHLVAVDITGWVVGGARFESTLSRSTPLKIRIGERRVLPAIEAGIRGMRPGARRALLLSPSQAFNPGREPEGVEEDSEIRFDLVVRDVQP